MIVVEPDVSVLACDVCGTLYRGNSTHDFALFVAERQASALARLRFRLGIFVSKIAYKLGAADVSHRVANRARLQMLAGRTEAELLALAAEFWDARCPQQLIPEVLRAVQQSVDRGVRVVLVSAAFDPVIRALAQRLGLEYRATRLEYDARGRLQSIAADLLGNKKSVLAELLATDGRVMFITDNHSDLAALATVHVGVFLCSKADRPTALLQELPHVECIEV